MNVDEYLNALAKQLVPDPEQLKKIERSKMFLISNIWGKFQDQLIKVEQFGSYDRTTNLPDTIDKETDVDIMVIFKKNQYQPVTYLKQIRALGEKIYTRSKTSSDHPTVVIELEHVKFEIVPAYIEDGFLSDTLYIPAPTTEDFRWIETDPDAFKAKLKDADGDNSNLIIPLIRIIKYWNVLNNYPFSSFSLERGIIKEVEGSNLRSCFYKFISELKEYELTEKEQEAVNKLIEQKRRLKVLEDGKMPDLIEAELQTFLPLIKT